MGPVEANLLVYFYGIITTTFVASGVVFLKYAKKTGESFFRWFGAACILLGLERAPGIFTPHPCRGPCYLLRLAAFLLILFAIFRANRRLRLPR